ncbi:MAG: hypothetical protein LOD92_09120 [Bacillales bacterium]
MAQTEYAMYKGDELLCIGTLDEIAQERGIKKQTAYYYTTNAYKRKLEKRKAKNAIVMVKLEDDEE